jgi:predicted phage terminase large subunit-like protein
LSVFDRHQQHKTLVESRVKHQVGDAMIVEIRERERIYGKHVNLYPVKPERDKVARVMYVQSLIQSGQVYVNRHDKEAQSLLSEATMFTDGSQNYHDDRLDALVHALTEIKDVRPSTRKAGKSHSALAGVWS